jgi:hypothetical protein
MATAYVRNCGATTDYSSIVSIHRPSDSFADDEYTVLVVKGRPMLAMSWRDAGNLSIRCHTCPRESIFRQLSILGNITIEYELD